METVKAFVRADNSVTITCPQCNMPKNASVGSFKDKCHYLKVKCPCSTVFRVHLDFRQHYRKPTELSGTYKCIKPAGMGGGTIIVKDISIGGIGFAVTGPHNISKGQVLILNFTLDDKKKTALKKKVIVQSVSNDFIGCHFSDNQLFEKALGFYLQG